MRHNIIKQIKAFTRAPEEFNLGVAGVFQVDGQERKAILVINRVAGGGYMMGTYFPFESATLAGIDLKPWFYSNVDSLVGWFMDADTASYFVAMKAELCHGFDNIRAMKEFFDQL